MDKQDMIRFKLILENLDDTEDLLKELLLDSINKLRWHNKLNLIKHEIIEFLNIL